ncbi:MAG: hypothetical protein M1812_003701 [Candelaria pacifica]|nr:MAG: hypothetical protein M1812_003701 [Candelaria pacifica]
MASVSSLDKDLRNMRLSKYTPQAANEVREWIEEVLEDRLPGGDLLDALKDGVALCKLVNLAVPPPGVKYKSSPMPFVQMENISHFLRACQAPPLSLPPHDVFLTVDLYEAKDPAQVLQCLGAFSRKANALQPARFKTAIGPKGKGGAMSPQTTGSSSGGYGSGYGATKSVGSPNYGASTTFNPVSRSGGFIQDKSATSSPAKPFKPPLNGGTSSWSKKTDEGATTPAWNIHQYGYMGGASQGNQGISFGGRRQITSQGPSVPSLADKERRRKEEEAGKERLRMQAEEAEHKRRVEREAEEEKEKILEEQRWEEETRRQREKERLEVEEEKERWEADERKWREDEEKRMKEEKELEARLNQERQRNRAGSDARLKGQFLSQYQAEQSRTPKATTSERNDRTSEQQRIRDLEVQLEKAREREHQYELERQQRMSFDGGTEALNVERPKPAERPVPDAPPPLPANKPPPTETPEDNEDSWQEDEREYLRHEWNNHNEEPPPAAPPTSSRPLPDPTPVRVKTNNIGPSTRPLPDPASYTTPTPSRTDRFLATNPAPVPEKPKTHYPSELSLTSTSEHSAETSRREASTQKTKAGGWASKSLLEREMERERQRQQEWEEAQKATKQAALKDVRDGGVGPGESWDVNQYGYVGGDSQNKAGVGLGGRRQIIGPRPPP